MQTRPVPSKSPSWETGSQLHVCECVPPPASTAARGVTSQVSPGGGLCPSAGTGRALGLPPVPPRPWPPPWSHRPSHPGSPDSLCPWKSALSLKGLSSHHCDYLGVSPRVAL